MKVRRFSSIAVAIFAIIVVIGNAQDVVAQIPTADRDASSFQEWTISVEKRLLSIEEAMANLNRHIPRAKDWDSVYATPPVRAIVAARLIDDKPDTGGAWKGRLISMDLAVTTPSEYVRRIDPGAQLVLVNLCDEDVKFTFDPAILEEGYVFSVPADGVLTVTVKAGVEVDENDDKRIFSVSSDTYFSALPGPFVLIP